MKITLISSLKCILPVLALGLVLFSPSLAAAHWYCVQNTTNPQDYVDRPAVTYTATPTSAGVSLNVTAKFCYSTNMNAVAVSSWGFGSQSAVCPNPQLNNSCGINQSDDRGLCGLQYWSQSPSIFPSPLSGDYAPGAGNTSLTQVSDSRCASGQMWVLNRNITLTQSDYANISGSGKGFSVGLVSTDRKLSECGCTGNHKTYPSAFVPLSAVNVACNTNSDCGTNGLTGSLFCQNNNVYQNYITYTCNNSGTASSSCTSSTTAQLQTTCSGNQTCQNGSCSNNQSNLYVSCLASPSSIQSGQSSTFSANATGGSGAYAYIWSGACTGSSQTCTNSFTSQGIQTAAVTVTSGSQTASNNCSVYVGQNYNYPTCTSNYQERCSGNSLYWYDSCGNQQNFVQYCPNGCYNNYCQGYVSNCTYHSSQRCSGNNLYWYDSCGNQQDLAQYCSNGCYNNACQYNSTGNLNVTKTVKDLTTGSGFASSTYASPSDMLLFLVTIQNNSGQDVQNVFVRDTLPANLIYNNQLVVACTTGNGYNSYNNNYNNCNNSNYNYSGSVTSGINLNTIYAGQTVTVSYQAQVASAQNFSYGTTTLNNNVSVTGSSSGYIPASNASVIVTRSTVLGASTVSTGLTNNFWLDSFFLPLIITLAGIWMLKSGMFLGIEKWLEGKRKLRRTYQAHKELTSRIEQIKKYEE